jgi:hypothetical protein
MSGSASASRAPLEDAQQRSQHVALGFPQQLQRIRGEQADPDDQRHGAADERVCRPLPSRPSSVQRYHQDRRGGGLVEEHHALPHEADADRHRQQQCHQHHHADRYRAVADERLQ